MITETTYHVAEERKADRHEGGCPCGCAPCPEGCGLECLERPRYFCGQLLTDADLTALVEWTRARLGLVRHRDGWGVVCGLDVRCDPRKPSAIEIGEGYAVSCCGSDIVLCKPELVDLSDACRSPESLCDDPCAPKPEESADLDDKGERSPWPCPDGVWVDVLIDAADEEAGGRPALATDGCKRLGSCEASRVREGHRITMRPSAGDPLLLAENRWRERYDRCVETFDSARLPRSATRGEDSLTYGELRLAVEQFALDNACEGGCRALRWICAPGRPADKDPVSDALVQRVRLALLLDCLIAVGRCDCQTCKPDAAVMLARVLVVPAATEKCPCRVVAVDDVPPYRRPLGHDCPPARLGQVNLGDLLGQRPEGAGLETERRGITVLGERELEAGPAFAWLDRSAPPIVDHRTSVEILKAWDECLGWRVIGFGSGARGAVGADAIASERVGDGAPAAPAPAHPLMRVEEMTPRRVELLAERNITSLEHLAGATTRDLRGVFPGRTTEDLEGIIAEAHKLVGEEGE